MLEFLSGKPIQIRDIFPLGKYTEKPSTSFYSRPVLIKYRLDAEVEETTLFREPRALGCLRPERQRGRY